MTLIDRPPSDVVSAECSICHRRFTKRGLTLHMRAHSTRLTQRANLERSANSAGNFHDGKVTKKIRRRASKAERAEIAEQPWGPDPESWRRPKPGMKVVEVIEELSDAELQRLMSPGGR